MPRDRLILPVVLHVGRIPPQREWHMARHQHEDHHELIMVVGGALQADIHDRQIVGRSGDMLFYPRGVPHAEAAVGNRPLETLFVGWRETGGPDPSAWPTLVPDRKGRLEFLMRWMHELAAGRTQDQPTLRGLMRAVLGEFAAQAAEREDDVVARVRRHVHEHLADPMQLADLAQVACLSPFHFSRLFARATGKSPMRYVAEARVEAARGLLRTSPAPMRQIAAMVGFRDEFELSRVFRRIEGLPPSKARHGR